MSRPIEPPVGPSEPEPTPWEPSLNRRRVFELFGASAAVAAVAACSRSTKGDGGDQKAEVKGASASSGKAGNANNSGTGGDRTFRAAYPFDAPPKGNFNFLGGVSEQIGMGYLFDLFMAPGAMYLWETQKYFYLLADESSALSPDGKKFTYKLRPGLKWSDGTPLTAKDLYATWRLRQAGGHPVFSYVSGFKQVDDLTVVFTIATPAPISEYYLLREHPVPAADFGKWADQLEPLLAAGKTATDSAVSTIVAQVNSFRPKSPIVSGPFIIDYSSVVASQLSMTKNPHGYLGDKINFDRVTVANGVIDNDVMPLLLTKKLDYATYGFPVPSERSIAKAGYRIVRPPRYDGQAVYFNFGKYPEFSDKRVRQAFAHALRRDQTGTIAMGPSGQGVKYMAGFSDLQVPTWISPADRKKLNSYNHDPDAAEALLKAAGWKKSGGSWQTPQGKKATYDLAFQAGYAEGQSTSQSVEEDFAALGIKLTLIGVDPTLLQTDIDKGRFQMAIYGWGSTSNPFPAAAFKSVMVDDNEPTLKPDKGIDFPLQQQTTAVGNVDLAKVVVAAGVGKDTDALKANITTAALAFNELLPVIPIWAEYGNNPVLESAVTGWPADGDPIYRNSPYADNFAAILLYQGTLRPA